MVRVEPSQLASEGLSNKRRGSINYSKWLFSQGMCVCMYKKMASQIEPDNFGATLDLRTQLRMK